jgi:hypothetical protein
MHGRAAAVQIHFAVVDHAANEQSTHRNFSGKDASDSTQHRKRVVGFL